MYISIGTTKVYNIFITTLWSEFLLCPLPKDWPQKEHYIIARDLSRSMLKSTNLWRDKIKTISNQSKGSLREHKKWLLTWSDIWIRRCMAMDALNSECPTTKKSPFPCWLGNLDKSSTMDPIVWLYLELVHISLLWSLVIIKNFLYSFVRRQFTIILISAVHKPAGWARSYQYWIFLTNLILVFNGLGKFKGF